MLHFTNFIATLKAFPFLTFVLYSNENVACVDFKCLYIYLIHRKYIPSTPTMFLYLKKLKFSVNETVLFNNLSNGE